MLASGRTTAQIACLRCQLRLTLLRFRKQRLPAHLRPVRRTLSTSRKQRHEVLVDDDFTRSDLHDTGYTFKHIQPNGRIVGKAGRRQRALSEQLKTNSLGKPSEVIVFRDVEEGADAAKRQQYRLAKPEELQELQLEGVREGLSAQEIDRAIKGGQETSEEQEVNVSIDSLRPSNAVLEQDQFSEGVKQLFQGYNVKQLARYLIRSLSQRPHPSKSVNKSSEKHAITETQWRPGVTPLEQRLSSISFSKDNVGTSKAKVADQIMRLAWGVTVHAEEQQPGELELRCQAWMLEWMFATGEHGLSNYERYVVSPFLARTSEVRPYRPDGVIRITARRQDAEELSRLIQEQLRRVGMLEMKLKVFKPLASSPRREGWERRLFRDDIIKEISTRTNTVILFDSHGKTLELYSLEEHERLDARRLLLSMLDLPTPRLCHVVRIPGDRAVEHPQTIEYPATNVHRRYRGLGLTRTVFPQCADEIGPHGLERRSATANQLVKHLARDDLTELGKAITTKSASLQQWPLKVHSWMASFASLLDIDQHRSNASILRQSKAPAPERRGKSSRLELHQPLGIAPLLTYFGPAARSSRGTVLVAANFRPSPYGPYGIEALRHLPIIRASFAVEPTHGPNVLTERFVRFTFMEHQVDVRVPAQATDLIFTRKLYASGRHMDLASTSNWNDISLSLKESLKSESGRVQLKNSVLHIKDFAKMLPSLGDASQKWARVAANMTQATGSAEYFLDRIEQSQSYDFTPVRDPQLLGRMSPEVREVFEKWPDGLVLVVREAEDGAFGARRTELNLRWHRTQIFRLTIGDRYMAQYNSEEMCAKLAETAFSVLRLLTMANCGQLEPFTAAASVEKPDWMRWGLRGSTLALGERGLSGLSARAGRRNDDQSIGA